MAGFTYEVPVRFADIDGAGILFYPRFLEFFHVAFEEMFNQALSLDHAEVILKRRVGFPMRKLEVEFERPLLYGDAALVRVTPVRLGKSSMEFRYEVLSKKTGQVTTRAHATTVTVDLARLEPIPTPDWIREPMSRLLESA